MLWPFCVPSNILPKMRALNLSGAFFQKLLKFGIFVRSKFEECRWHKRSILYQKKTEGMRKSSRKIRITFIKFKSQRRQSFPEFMMFLDISWTKIICTSSCTSHSKEFFAQHIVQRSPINKHLSSVTHPVLHERHLQDGEMDNRLKGGCRLLLSKWMLLCIPEEYRLYGYHLPAHKHE